jgi:hypothetical protein
VYPWEQQLQQPQQHLLVSVLVQVQVLQVLLLQQRDV